MKQPIHCRTCKTCFSGDQMVLLPDHSLSLIKNINVGDAVMGFDLQKRILKPAMVLDKRKTDNVKFAEYHFQTDTIIATEFHKLLSSKYDWIDFKDSMNDSFLVLDTNHDLEVQNMTFLQYINEPQTAYSLDTTTNTYIVQDLIVKGFL